MNSETNEPTQKEIRTNSGLMSKKALVKSRTHDATSHATFQITVGHMIQNYVSAMLGAPCMQL